MHVDEQGTQQSRLASHTVNFDRLYITKLPWLSMENESSSWVRVYGTLPLTNKTIQGKTLKQAIEARFLSDPSMLPTACETDTVQRNNIELYHTREQVAVTYTPTTATDPKIEFLIFESLVN